MKRLAGFVSAIALVFAAACSQTDAGITTKIKTSLVSDPVVKPYDVDVTTRNRVVTLTGSVDTTAAKAQAVRIAHQTDGVRDVIDQLRVTETAPTSGLLDRSDRAVDSGVDAATAAAGKVATTTKRAAKRAAAKVKDAVTPDQDRDSDRDGK